MKLHVFDFDGTLVDSDSVWEGLAESCLLKLGIKESTQEDLGNMTLDASAAFFAQKYGTDKEAMRELFRQELRERYRGVKAIESEVELAKKLHDSGEFTCIATASERELATAVLRRLGIDKYFAFVTDTDELGFGKDDERFYAALAEKAGKTEALSEMLVYDLSYENGVKFFKIQQI